MYSRGNGPISKTKANLLAKLKVKNSIRIMTVAIAIATGLLFLVFTGEASGTETTTEEAAQAVIDENIRQEAADTRTRQHLRKQVVRHKRKADRWYHKRTNRHYKRAHWRTPYYKSVPRARQAERAWRRMVRRQRSLYIRHQKAKAALINNCVRAGWPRRLCPAVIEGTKRAGVPSWHRDPQFAWIAKHESGFRPCVRNGGIVDCSYRGDRAFGLFQFLGSTWGGVGCKITPDATTQVVCGARYVKRRYYSPSGATRFWRANHWY